MKKDTDSEESVSFFGNPSVDRSMVDLQGLTCNQMVSYHECETKRCPIIQLEVLQ
ncbi:hypothetical protein C7459_101371 [Tumebacillus permanentifrigoris]|uniref:Uncharacterized protein n=1 Tax=Tumebacillus permanentifrigoris TaxID=378543 RepID=A0A316DEW7_9BACL|nr:hypothetical protein C7459_101371 [Tumebacillus permanentifrigoris]